MNRFIRLTAALLLCVVAVAAAQARIINRIAAVVGPDIISTFEVERLFAYERSIIDPALPQQERAQAEAELKNRILEALVQDKLLDQEINRLGLEVTDMEIDDAMKELLAQSGMRQEDLASALASEGKTLDDLRDQVGRRIKKERYVQYRLKGGITVDEEEIRNYYQQHMDEFVKPPIIEVGEIRINVPRDADQAAVNDRYSRAVTLLQLVAGGEDFREVARAFSDAPTKADGGSLGKIEDVTKLKVEYQQALKGLQPGLVSAVFRDDKGFFFVTVLSQTPAGALPFEQARGRIYRTLFDRAVDREMQKINRELLAKTHVEIKVDYVEELKGGGQPR